MLVWLEGFLTQWLRDPGAFGAHSWLELLSWGAALVIAVLAAVSLRRQSLQGRAEFLLDLYERWNDLDPSKKEFADLFKETRDAVRSAHGDQQEKYQITHLKAAALEKLTALQAGGSVRFRRLMSLMNFFEMLGTFTKNRYLPIKDVIQLYKGPILEAEIVYSDFVAQWQKRAHTPPGLYKHALYLMGRTKRRETYWFLRWFL